MEDHVKTGGDDVVDSCIRLPEDIETDQLYNSSTFYMDGTEFVCVEPDNYLGILGHNTVDTDDKGDAKCASSSKCNECFQCSDSHEVIHCDRHLGYAGYIGVSSLNVETSVQGQGPSDGLMPLEEKKCP